MRNQYQLKQNLIILKLSKRKHLLDEQKNGLEMFGIQLKNFNLENYSLKLNIKYLEMLMAI